MSGAAEHVDVQKIVDQIKAEIAEEYTDQEVLAFEPVTFSSSLVYTNPGSVPNKAFLEDRLASCFNDRDVVWNRSINGGGVSALVMKTIKRLTRFFIAPIVEDQNRFNFEITDVALQMKMLIDEQDKVIESMQRKISELEDELSR